jgi:hypothetical protein
VSDPFGVNFSELNHGQDGDSLEIAKIPCRNVKTQVQYGGANQQVLKCKLDTHCLLLAFDAPGQASDSEGYGMDGQITRKAFDEFQSPLLLSQGLRALRAMDQLSDRHD